MPSAEIPTVIRINGQLYQRPDGFFESNVATGDILYLMSDDGGNHYKVIEVRRPDPTRSTAENYIDPSKRVIEVYYYQDGIIDQICRTWTILEPMELSWLN